MNNLDWNVLKTIYEEKSLNKAAEKLLISQPSLTYRIKRIETEVGAKILTRHAGGVNFTPKGKIVLNYAIEMENRFNALRNQLQNESYQESISFKLGCSTVVSQRLLAPLLKLFQSQHPEIKVELITGSSTTRIPKLLHSGAIQIAIMRDNNVNWDECQHVLSEDAYGIFTSSPFPLKDLNKLSWIQSEGTRHTKSYRIFYDWWKRNFCDEPPESIIMVDTIEACLQMVSQGLGWTWATELHVHNHSELHFQSINDINGHPITRKTVLLYKDSQLSNPAVKAFIDCTLDYIKAFPL